MMYRIFVCTMLLASTADVPAASIDTERLSSIVKELASEEYEGRAPGTPGGRKTVDYLVEQFRALGLEPGGDDGAWTDEVPMIHTLFEGPGDMRFVVDGEPRVLRQKVDIEASTVRAVDAIDIDAPVAFVGFGAYAPERDWDDYGDIDLRGKVALYLVNDPDFAAEPAEPAAGLFGSRKMTYYGRWAYKFEEAERRGAVAALVIGAAARLAALGHGGGPDGQRRLRSRGAAHPRKEPGIRGLRDGRRALRSGGGGQRRPLREQQRACHTPRR